MKNNSLSIYTDGSTHTNPGVGGFSFVVVNGSDTIIKRYSKFVEIATNNQAELLAIIYAMRWFKENMKDNEKVIIYSDSAYCVKPFSEGWIHNWRKNDWRINNDVNFKLRRNSTLWIQFYEVMLNIYDFLDIKWVKGHNGNKYNEIAHDLAYNVWKNKIKNKNE